jgi:hypothetical protein
MNDQNSAQGRPVVKLGNATVCNEGEVWLEIGSVSSAIGVSSHDIYKHCPSRKEFCLRHDRYVSRCFVTFEDVMVFLQEYDVCNSDVINLLRSEVLHFVAGGRVLFIGPPAWIPDISLPEE